MNNFTIGDNSAFLNTEMVVIINIVYFFWHVGLFLDLIIYNISIICMERPTQGPTFKPDSALGFAPKA
jgi:hypothetical protein